MITPNNMISLYDLSEKTGVEARTLRSWIAADLLAGPDKAGRGALYPESNIDRVQAVLALKEKYSISEISRMFLTASDELIQDWAAGRIPENSERNSPLDYIKSIRSRAPKNTDMPSAIGLLDGNYPHEMRTHHRMKNSDSAGEDLAAIERLLLQLDQLVNGSFAKRVRGETWTRMGVTRDIELSVRGTLRPDELRQFEILAGQLRTILTRRIKNE